MQAVIINGSSGKYDLGIKAITEIVKSTFHDLGVEVVQIDIESKKLQYFSGTKNNEVKAILDEISKSEAVIIASTVHMGLPSAMLKTFLEYFELEEYRRVLDGKNCMTITVSSRDGEHAAADHIRRMILMCGGYEAVRVAVGGNMYKELGRSESLTEVIEKQIEDYYRISRQSRRFIPSSESMKGLPVTVPTSTFEIVADNSYDEPDLQTSKAPEKFSKQQEDDIEELARLFQQKLSSKSTKESKPQLQSTGIYSKSLTNIANSQAVVHRAKTCKQMTLSLPHYFQTQHASGLDCIMQINISGSEEFNCYLMIRANDSNVYEGINNEPDIVIAADSVIWTDILRGKFSAQKAFMTGQIKVKGNFMMLNRFDVIFKKME